MDQEIETISQKQFHGESLLTRIIVVTRLKVIRISHKACHVTDLHTDAFK